ncbi:MAG: histidinol-phosphate transaminase [Thermodesulfobacteriaceae bacterium]|nr:histidinol-phosphate transaminase [Thermodesulfobacteriaceae bacterium]
MNPKPWLAKIIPYPPGKSLEEIKRELALKEPIYKLNSNENPLGPSPKVIHTLANALPQIHLYPEASYSNLRKALAKKWGISQEEIILGNGSNEILEFLFKAYLDKKDEIIISNPSFLMYEKFAQRYGIKCKKIPLTKDLKHNLKKIKKNITSRTKAIFLDHPHNPTGQCLPKEAWEEFFKHLPSHLLVVIDEAYGEFIEDPHIPLGIEFLKRGYPVLITRTFSKAFGLAGLRLGYGMAAKEIIENLDKVRQPFNVNLLAVLAGLAALEDVEYQQKSIHLVLKGRKFLSQALKELGFKVFPSQANFLMVDFKEFYDVIYDNLTMAGFFIRPLDAYGYPTCFRITIGTEEANRKLILKIKEIIKL